MFFEGLILHKLLHIRFLTSLNYVLGVLKYMKIISKNCFGSKWLFLINEIHYLNFLCRAYVPQHKIK